MFEIGEDIQRIRNDEFHRACLAGDKDKALRILDENPDDPHLIDVTRSDMPAILVASHAQAWTLCVELIQRGVDLNVKNRQGYSPLHVYAQHGHEELIRLAIENAAFIHRKDSKGQSALYYAAKADKEAACELLLSLGAEANTLTLEKDSPIHWASRNGNSSLAKKLIVAGSHAHGENDHGETPVTLAKSDDMRAELEKADLQRVVAEAEAARKAEADAAKAANPDAPTDAPATEEAKPKRRILKA